MQTDFLIVGTGIAGLNLALQLCHKGKITLITKTSLQTSNSAYAQGGIAAVLSKHDSFQNHINDTLKAGSHHNTPEAVELMVKKAPQALKQLIQFGVEFDQELAKEGGHSHRRISFKGDYTGAEIIEKLSKKALKQKNITIIENCFAVDLITQNNQCHGITILQNEKITPIYAGHTILATGGLGQVFSKTTNPAPATGDGLAMSIRAGLKTKDLEFIQFHPTALDHGQSPLFLISEAVRGEGAILINEQNKQFIDPLKPRDQVSQAIYQQKKAFLKIEKPKTYLQRRFPRIYQKLASLNIKMESDKIPITPVAHYACGGIITNLKGETSLKNLHACGEITHTGVHGANRLASNSLLESIVFGNQIAENIDNIKPQEIQINIKPQAINHQHKKQIQTLMWDNCGIVRKNQDLQKLQKVLKSSFKITNSNTQEDLQTANILTVAKAITAAALNRKNSLGCHKVEQ